MSTRPSRKGPPPWPAARPSARGLPPSREAALAGPGRPGPHAGRGIAAAGAGLDDEAIRSLERYLMLAPDAPDAAPIRARIDAQRRRRSERLASVTLAGG